MNFPALLLGCLLLTALPAAASASPAQVRVIAVQMAVTTDMYRDLATFRTAMDRIFAEVAKRRARTCPTLVALPEDVGLGLVFIGQWDAIKDAKDIRQAGSMLGTKWAPDVMARITAHGISATRALLLVANDRWLRAAYIDTFSELAARYKVYLAAGSAPLSETGSADVKNVSVLFGPDGKVLGRWAKVHLIDLEGPGGLDLVPGNVADLGVARTPFGAVGTAVCYDGFHDDVLDHLVGQGARFILQPSFNPQVWTPEQETDWETGLWQRLKTRPGVVGVNPMATGRLFDIICEGRSNMVGSAAPANGYYARAKSPTQPGLVVADIRR